MPSGKQRERVRGKENVGAAKKRGKENVGAAKKRKTVAGIYMYMYMHVHTFICVYMITMVK